MKTEDIITERMILRSMTLDDCDFAASLWGDPEAGQYLNNPPFTSGDELREIIFDIEDWQEEYPFIAYDRISNRPIGTCSLGVEGPEGEWGFGYDVVKDMWGRGYASEMARAMIELAYSLGVRDFYCTVAKDNIASCRVMEKCGLKANAGSSFKNHNTGVDHKSTIYRMKLD